MEEGEEEREEEGSSSDLLHPLSSFRAIGRRIEATTTTRIHVHWASFRSLEASSFFSLFLSLSLFLRARSLASRSERCFSYLAVLSVEPSGSKDETTETILFLGEERKREREGEQAEIHKG